jgi:isopenicillin N synthase-like dioxygenase
MDCKRECLVSVLPEATLPVIDLTSFGGDSRSSHEVASELGRACRESGFFYVAGHGVEDSLCERLEEQSREFFALGLETKMQIRMERGGRAWRGYFPVGAELTSGKPDQKEGLYFGAELPPDHPKVQAGVPLFGANLFPDLPGFRETVLEYMHALTMLGHRVMEVLALSLGLERTYFHDRYTADPLILFRIFHYPPTPGNLRDASTWGVGEHTDYGLLTILKQDEHPGLEVKSPAGWIKAPPLPGTFVCNIGDMLDRMTGGLYRSTPHRVQNQSSEGRLSLPFFFDPNFDVEIRPITPDLQIEDDKGTRWDQASVHEFSGTYGDYVLKKVSKVFPELRRTI